MRSLPAWECGLKSKYLYIDNGKDYVTPCMGVWIEINKKGTWNSSAWCHSLHGSVDWNAFCCTISIKNGCHSLHGSVDWNHIPYGTRMILAPRHSLHGSVDWNQNLWKLFSKNGVTPCMGVWIEIIKPSCPTPLWASLPAWECGLKLSLSEDACTFTSVTPCMGVWIEIRTREFIKPFTVKSLPAWECGLKFLFTVKFFLSLCVTPCMGVWIEMSKFGAVFAVVTVTPCMGEWIEMDMYMLIM